MARKSFRRYFGRGRARGTRRSKPSIPVIEVLGLIGEGVSLTCASWGTHGSVVSNLTKGNFSGAGVAFLDAVRKPEAHAPLLITGAGVVGRKVIGKVPITRRFSLF